MPTTNRVRPKTDMSENNMLRLCQEKHVLADRDEELVESYVWKQKGNQMLLAERAFLKRDSVRVRNAKALELDVGDKEDRPKAGQRVKSICLGYVGETRVTG